MTMYRYKHFIAFNAAVVLLLIGCKYDPEIGVVTCWTDATEQLCPSDLKCEPVNGKAGVCCKVAGCSAAYTATEADKMKVLDSLVLGSSGGSRPGTGGNTVAVGGKGGAVVNNVDVLFVIDNSGSMQRAQEKLRKSFPAFINTLAAIPKGIPNLHIGIVSSDVGAGNVFISGNPACNRPGGDKGEFQVKSGCGLGPATGNFIISSNNDTTKNFTGKIEDVFSCLADLGTKGCEYEHPLQAVRIALAENVTPSNAGFLRLDALLVIIIVTDEDDCSGQPTSDLYADQGFSGQSDSLRCNIVGHVCNGKNPPASEFSSPLEKCPAAPSGGGRLILVEEITAFVSAFKKGFPERIIVSAITGTSSEPSASYGFKRDLTTSKLTVQPICSGRDGTAAPSLRNAAFVKAYGKNGTLESICADDFGPALARVGEKIAALVSP